MRNVVVRFDDDLLVGSDNHGVWLEDAFLLVKDDFRILALGELWMNGAFRDLLQE